MNRNISFVKEIALFLFTLILFAGFYIYITPKSSVSNNSGVMHTYLVKIPNDAGVCPYALMKSSNGKLKMLDQSSCTCPFSEHASYMTARCKDEKSVMSLLPSSLQKKVQIKLIVISKKVKKIENLSI